MKLSDEQKNIINAPLGPIAVTACAGSGKTATAIRRLIAIRQKMKGNRGRVVLLSFSNVAVNTFNKGYAQLASVLPDDANRKRVEVDTLDGFFTQYILRPHAYRTMGAKQAAYLVSGSEPFLSSFQYWPEEGHPLPLKDIRIGIQNGNIFFTNSNGGAEKLNTVRALKVVMSLGQTGAYTHELGRYWVYQTLVSQPAVLRALAARYPHILVDEAQDLGTLHQAILELLIDAGVQVSLIGDVHQGIYGFAGADGSFLKIYTERADVTGYKLTRNYRSLPSIINIANLLCDRDDKPDRETEKGGAYFIGYQESELPKLFESFHAHIQELGMRHQDAVILSRGADRVAKLAGNATPPGRGTIATLSEAALLRDQNGLYHECFKCVCRAVVGLLANPPHGLSSNLQGSPHETWMLGLRRLLWNFSRNADTGLPSSTLIAKTEWHTNLVKNVRALLADIEKQYGFKTVGTLGNRLAKTALTDFPLIGEVKPKDNCHGMRVETVHQVKGESIGAVLLVATKANVKALLSGTSGEEGRIGYVAITRAKNLFLLAIPQSNLKELRGDLITAGFQERREPVMTECV
ncbi:ATP-dependent helicase [Salmonella enterica]|nr:ATP-dependent helicase [Salmonella enterica]EIJ1352813.1 ATP-dependent helicase [Salmonella enterica]EJP4923985.1 ATP-dependent helicase [Salmonella enterica]EJP8353146.1 ATP-dependent helicase [Salmonella enterica]EJP9224380.1 ATP-dependent helicase [Salmonella enterica]